MSDLFPGFEQRQVETSGATIALEMAGDGPPLLLLHGYPQTHAIWHKIAPRLAERFTVVCSDLRGYGDSGKPHSGVDHAAYSKRAMAQDQIEVMESLGFPRFAAAGHDRGGRVLHRLALDYPERVSKASVLDIAPTLDMYEGTHQGFATAYYHWFFLIQQYDLPEQMIAADPERYLERKIGAWGGADSGTFTPEALAEYKRCFSNPATIHASCEDYRASASIDLDLDRADLGRKIACPLLVLWGGRGVVERYFDPVALWQARAEEVEAQKFDCGHFLPEERPEETLSAFLTFFGDT